MKKTLFLSTVFVLLTFCLKAQNLSPEMQAVYDACMQLQSSINAGSTAGLRDANQQLKACNPAYFSSLHVVNEDQLPSLNGHFVFDYEFVDSLIINRAVYEFAENYAERCAERGTSSSNKDKVYMRTCMACASSSTQLTFRSRGPQELAVVAEPGGLITMRVHDTTNDKWYNDTKQVKKGQPSRALVFDLPTDKRCTLEVEVINKSNENISFVVISN